MLINIAYLSVDLLDVIVDTELVTFRVCRDSSVRITPHGYLVRLYKTHLTILIHNPERVAFSFEDDSHSLQTVDLIR